MAEYWIDCSKAAAKKYRTFQDFFFNTLYFKHITNQIALLYITYTTFQIDYIKLCYTGSETHKG